MCNQCKTSGVNLHSHTNASFDSIASPDKLVYRAAELGQKKLAITDHFELSGIVSAVIAGREVKIGERVEKVGIIAGVETYVDANESKDYSAVNSTHLTLLGNGTLGFNQLVKIQREAAYRAVNGTTNQRILVRPPTTVKGILDNSEHLIVLSGCPASIFNDTAKFDEAQAYSYYRDFKRVLGDRFYVEIMMHSEDMGGLSQVQRIRRAIKHCSDFNLRAVITSDIHYVLKEERPAHVFFNTWVNGFNYRDYGLYLKHAHETLTEINFLFDFGDEQGLKLTEFEKNYLVEALLEQDRIAERLEPIDFNTPIIMPSFENGDKRFLELVYAEYERHIMTKGEKLSQQLEQITNVMKAIPKDCDDYTLMSDELSKVLREIDEFDEYKTISKERLDREVEVIFKMNFQTYFLLVHEMHEYVVTNGGRRPNGRGSAGGSYVCFLLGIVALDPIVYELPFERFLNVLRDSAIDIDADFSPKDRDMLIEWAKEKYGAVPIATQIRYGHDSLINELARNINYGKTKDYETCLNFEITKKQAKALKADEVNFKKSETWKEIVAKYPQVEIIYDALINSARSKSRHAAGFVILPDTIKYEMPVTVDKNGNIICALTEGASGAEVSTFGFNKVDLLVNEAILFIALLVEATGVEPPVWKYDEYDESFQLLETRQTQGIFQFSGLSVSEYAKKHGVTNFRDIMDITSYSRKGVMVSGVHELLLNHRPVSGLPRRRSNGVKEDGNLLEIELSDGTVFKIYENWQIETENGWKLVKDLTKEDELIIE